MLIDEVEIFVKAGDGGDGLVHFYRDKWRPKGGPDGGDGGDGGSVVFRAVSDISKLHQFRHQKKYQAQDGAQGGVNQRTGKNGEDLVVQVPVGTVITYDNGTQFELTELDQRVLVAKGGKGGRGNYSYRSSTNQTPKEFQPGQKKEYRKLHLDLKLIADIGLIGLPNAGKTSLLNELTAANAKVANYPFTTLEPNLGVTKGNLIIADIPGLIEGASEGRGLGWKFLRHIERTRLLVHCISSDSSDPQRDYQTIIEELKNYSLKLVDKPQLVIITKSDLIENPKELKLKTNQIKAKMATSILDSDSIKKLNNLISKKLS